MQGQIFICLGEKAWLQFSHLGVVQKLGGQDEVGMLIFVQVQLKQFSHQGR